MLPGVLAGQYEPADMQIDLVRLCKAAGAVLIVDEPIGLAAEARQLLFSDRVPLPFEVLSVGIGSQPSFAGVAVEAGHDHLVAIKPMQTFLPRLDRCLASAASHLPHRGLRVVIVGAGAGGCEVALCLPAHLRTHLPACAYEIVLIQAQSQILPGVQASLRRRVMQLLETRGCAWITQDPVAIVTTSELRLRSGRRVPADVVVWATGAVGRPLLSQLGLPLDERGFLLTRPSLQTVADVPVFAVGDSGTIQNRPIAKAGVYAVRQGPVVWENIRRLCDGLPLRDFHPQSGFLKLLNSGDGQALGEYRGWSFRGRWVGKWKDHIDRSFMAMFQDYRPAEMAAPAQARSVRPVMRCAGCGGKVGGRLLGEVLHRLPRQPRPELLMGLDQPDDAAVLNLDNYSQVTVTTDFFQLPLEDVYLSGRIAALNALSDVWAMGATPLAALASIVVPPGSFVAQERFLFELLSGGVVELHRADAALAGGHTIEGDAPICGFTVIARQLNDRITSKGNLRPGDYLILTKPLGSGILLAGHMQARCEAAWMSALLQCLLSSNQSAAEFARQFNALAVTDVTGFGLAGHLIEMLNASQVDARLDLSQIQLLPGACALSQQGVESTLAPANREVATQIEIEEPLGRSPHYAALFDPQTNGGLLIALSEADYRQARDLLTRGEMMVVGRVTPRAGPRPRLCCLRSSR